ncbi:MAG: amidase [Frankiales bacterium]|nr:amidase [Frankiales bacterium]
MTAVACVPAPLPPVGRPAWWLREAMSSGRLGVREVVQAHLDRLAAVDPWLNAAAAVPADAALAEADRLQAELAAGAAPGPLFGLPFSVKDIIATAGVETSCGSAALRGNVPSTDAVAVRRLRAAGAILVAKSNCPEFAFGVTTDNLVSGVTRSPWGLHSPGGSSGGEAALVASGASAFGVGTDYGGSLRWPAQCCGILALRPGLGTVDGTGQLPEADGRVDGNAGPPGRTSVQRTFQVVGPLARNARDLALLLAVLSDRRVELPGPVRDLRIGWLDEDPDQHVGSDVQSAVRETAAALGAYGLAVQRTPGVLDGLHDAFNALRATDPMADLRAAVADRAGLLSPFVRGVLEAGASPEDQKPLWQRLLRLRARALAQLADTPVLLLPVAPASACDLEGNAEVDGERVAGFALMAQCRSVSALGFPALSIPVGSDRHGLPISVQVVAAPGREDLVLQVGLLMEELRGGWQPPPWLPPPVDDESAAVPETAEETRCLT